MILGFKVRFVFARAQRFVRSDITSKVQHQTLITAERQNADAQILHSNPQSYDPDLRGADSKQKS